MSIFGSLTTAVLGLTAQSRALGHISDNIANAQTLGYKRVNTSFETLVLESSGRLHSPGGLTVKPIFVNNIQGALQQVQSPTNVSIQGAGFFSVSKLSASATGPGQIGETVQTQTGTLNADNVYYTRVGDFELDKNRYLVNSAGFALNGWMYNSTTGQLDKDVIQPIQVNTLIDKPTSTTQIDYSANLPATPTAGVKIPTSSIQVFDTQGNARTVNLNWRQQGENDWRLFVTAPDSSIKPLDGSYTGGTTTISFGPNQAGVTALPHIHSLTFSGGSTNGHDQIRVGEIYKTTIDGKDYELEITAENVSSIRNYSGLANAMANVINSASPAAPVLALVSGAVVSLIARTPGKAVDIDTEITKKSPVTNAFASLTPSPATTTDGQSYRTNMLQSQIDIGDSFSVDIDDTDDGVANGTTITLTITAQNYATYENSSGALKALASKINAAGLDVVASTSGSQISLKRKTAGADFDSAPTFSVTNADTTPSGMDAAQTQGFVEGKRQSQQVTLIGNPGDVGAEFTVSVNGEAITYSTTGEEASMEDIAAALAAKVNSNSNLPVTATAVGVVVTLTAKAAATKPVTNTFTEAGTTATLTGTQFDVGDVYSIDVDGVDYTLAITKDNYEKYDTAAEILAYFEDAIVADGGTVTVNAAAGTIAITSATTIDANVENVTDISFSLQQTTVVGQTPAHIGLTFGTTPETVGTLTSVSTAFVGAKGSATSSATQTAGRPAVVTFTVDYGFGEQQISLNLGTFGQPGGVTQYAGKEINVTQFVQDGAPRGQFKDVVFNDSGEVVVNYDNGRSKQVARVPLL